MDRLAHQEGVVGQGDADGPRGGPDGSGRAGLRDAHGRYRGPGPTAVSDRRPDASENCSSAVLRLRLLLARRGRRRCRARNAARLRRHLEHLRRARTWSRARGSASRRGRATSRARACGRSPRGVESSLSTKIGPSTERSSSASPSGACCSKNARCGLENSLLDRALAAQDALDVGGAEPRLQRRRADVAAGHRVELDDHARRAAQLRRAAPRARTGRSLITRVVARGPARAARARRRPWRLSAQVGRVEEADEPDLAVERIEAERRDRRSGGRRRARSASARRCRRRTTARARFWRSSSSSLIRRRRVAGHAGQLAGRRVTAPHPARVVDHHRRSGIVHVTWLMVDVMSVTGRARGARSTHAQRRYGRAWLRYPLLVALVAAPTTARRSSASRSRSPAPSRRSSGCRSASGSPFLYLGGLALWPGVLIGDLLVNDYGALPLGTALAQTAGNLLEVAGRDVAAAPPRPRRRRRSTASAGSAACWPRSPPATLVSATIGTLAQLAGGVDRVRRTAHGLAHLVAGRLHRRAGRGPARDRLASRRRARWWTEAGALEGGAAAGRRSSRSSELATQHHQPDHCTSSSRP